MAIEVKTIPIVTVARAGQRQALATSSILVYAASVQSLRTNTGYQYIGDKNVTSSNGQEFGPSDVVEIEPPNQVREQFDLSEIYVDSSTDAAEFRVSAWIRK